MIIISHDPVTITITALAHAFCNVARMRQPVYTNVSSSLERCPQGLLIICMCIYTVGMITEVRTYQHHGNSLVTSGVTASF